MTRDLVVFGVLVGAFAALVTSHVTLGLGLARRRSWARGLTALVVFPLAPWWGFRERMRARSAAWTVSAVVYACAWVFAVRG